MFHLANPGKFQKITESLYPFINILAFTIFLIGMYFSFFASPPDYLQGQTVRIMYIHVPSAWLSLSIYSIMAICSCISIVWKHTLSDIVARSAAPIGATFTLVTLITGSIWGKPTWGTWWVWDARLTSELILFFIYCGHILISNSFDDYRKGDKAASILTLVGIINLPIIKWSVDWWNTLHQPASISKLGSPNIDPQMLVPLSFMTIAFFLFFISILIIRVRGEIYIRKIEVIKLNN